MNERLKTPAEPYRGRLVLVHSDEEVVATAPSRGTQVMSESMSAPAGARGMHCMISESSWGHMLAVAKAEAMRLTHDDFHADDLAATVVKRLYSREADVSQEARDAYVRACVRNAFIDEIRRDGAAMRRGHAQELPLDDELAAVRNFAGEPLSPTSPSNKVIRRERKVAAHELVEQIFAGLNERQRLMLMLAASETSNEEIATMLGYANSDTVKTTISRLRKKIRDDFGTDIERLFREW